MFAWRSVLFAALVGEAVVVMPDSTFDQGTYTGDADRKASADWLPSKTASSADSQDCWNRTAICWPSGAQVAPRGTATAIQRSARTRSIPGFGSVRQRLGVHWHKGAGGQIVRRRERTAR